MESQKSLLEFMDFKERFYWEKRLAYEELLRSRWGSLHLLIDDKDHVLDRVDERMREREGGLTDAYFWIEREVEDVARAFECRPKDYINQALALWISSLDAQKIKGYIEGFNVKFILD